jgi:hypothetical protein
MTRNLKALGLALVAVFAFAAITSSAAQATPQFTGYETPSETHVHTIIKGTTENVEPFSETLTTNVGKVHCHVTYEATSLTGIDTELTVKPISFKTPGTSGEGCLATAGGAEFKADVSANSCDYVVHSGKKLKADEYTGTIDVKCNTAGDFIDIKITKSGTEETKCTTKFPAQEGLTHAIFRNERKPVGETHTTAEVTISKANGKGLTYITEGGLLNCGQANGEHKEEGVYEGKITLQGQDTAANPLDLEVSGE